MGKILAIDPGNQQSGFTIIDSDTYSPIHHGKADNRALLDDVIYGMSFDEVVIEMVASYGMPVGASVFETCVWIGRFTQAIEDHYLGCIPVTYLRRGQVKLNICKSGKANDATIRTALWDRFAPGISNYGKGTKDDPGWFYGFKADVWQAYALGVTYVDMALNKDW